jgi:hypothetical protein
MTVTLPNPSSSPGNTVRELPGRAEMTLGKNNLKGEKSL